MVLSSIQISSIASAESLPIKLNLVKLLTGMMVLLPAIGYPSEELLQDTLKSILVSFFTLATAIYLFFYIIKQPSKLTLHSTLLLPLCLLFFALVSMYWSHSYLSAVESCRWLIFSLILLIGLNCITLSNVYYLVWGIHIGSLFASLWTALQFWFDFNFFAQGPNPASTFVNRNFFAEYIVCTIPFSVLLITRIKDKVTVFLLTFSLSFIVVALLMTGTRSALVALFALLFIITLILLAPGKASASSGWTSFKKILLYFTFFLSIFLLGSLQTKNEKIISESGNVTALQRSLNRSISIIQPEEYGQGSFSVRISMWQSTFEMIRSNPWLGVGAGAWEVQIPLYQNNENSLEPDFYAHNEILQLIAEYGFAGWIFLFFLLLFLANSAYVTLKLYLNNYTEEALLRALTLSSIFALLLISNAGFPWRLASTGAIFALSISILAASDCRVNSNRYFLATYIQFSTLIYSIFLTVFSVFFAIAIYIAFNAIECESKLIRASKLALTISHSNNPNLPYWNEKKIEILHLVNEGIAINPHYRKIIPIAADEMARWGDWQNAIKIWSILVKSRPYISAIHANIVRGYLKIGDIDNAKKTLDSSLKIFNKSSALSNLKLIQLIKSNQELEAISLSNKLLTSKVFDKDTLNTIYALGLRKNNHHLSILATKEKIKFSYENMVDNWLKLGHLYLKPDINDKTQALYAFQSALNLSPSFSKPSVMQQIPVDLIPEMR